MQDETKKLSRETIESISDRLSLMDDLYFPRAVIPTATTPSERKAVLIDLLFRDVAVFLERYGPKLTSEELQRFVVLKDDYEINWHLKHLQSLLSPTSEEIRSRSVTVKNRRRAYMNNLMNEGKYFSEDAMRERDPYLHHEYVGKFQDPSGRNMARPGERWSDTLMRRAEEAMLVAKIRLEQQRLGVDEKDWVGSERVSTSQEMEEEEEEEEDEEEEDEEEEEDTNHPKANGAFLPSAVQVEELDESRDQPTSTGGVERQILSEAEMQDQMDQFTSVMQQRFLSGEDQEHMDYSKIDVDESLDDHWMREADHDAEEKYFAED